MVANQEHIIICHYALKRLLMSFILFIIIVKHSDVRDNLSKNNNSEQNVLRVPVPGLCYIFSTWYENFVVLAQLVGMKVFIFQFGPSILSPGKTHYHGDAQRALENALLMISRDKE